MMDEYEARLRETGHWDVARGDVMGDGEPRFRRGDDVRSKRYPGIAMWVTGYATRDPDPMGWDPWDGPYDERPKVVDYQTAVVRMVGDDRDIEIDIADLEPLDPDDFCPECGQIGCAWR